MCIDKYGHFWRSRLIELMVGGVFENGILNVQLSNYRRSCEIPFENSIYKKSSKMFRNELSLSLMLIIYFVFNI